MGFYLSFYLTYDFKLYFIFYFYFIFLHHCVGNIYDRLSLVIARTARS